MAELPTLKFNDGNSIPMVSQYHHQLNVHSLTHFQLGYGLGTARYKADPTAPVDEEIVDATVMALKAGYYHLDGAQGKSFFQPSSKT